VRRGGRDRRPAGLLFRRSASRPTRWC